MRDHVLLTGATGFLGDYLLKDLLSADVPVAVLIREHGGQSVQQRLENILDRWEERLGYRLPSPVPLTGDLNQDGLGLSSDDRNWVARHCSAVLHNAASLQFVGGDRAGEPWQTNVIGTQRIIDLCRDAAIREAHYVSTAYVCGRRSDTVFEEDTEAPLGFRNDYEHSKHAAEMLLRQATGLDRLTIYRPAIIVGDYHTGFTSSYHGFYTYLHFISVIKAAYDVDETGRTYNRVRLNITGRERRNFVPVDWVSRLTVRLLCDRNAHNRTYHLTPQVATKVHEFMEAAQEYFKFYGFTYEGAGDISRDDMNDVERLFYESVSLYEGYWQAEPVFDLSNTARRAPDDLCPVIDGDALRRLIDFAVADRWGWSQRQRRRKRRTAVRAG